MSLDADLIVDRRRMRRKLTFWRVVAIVLIVLTIGVAAAVLGNRSGLVSGPYIARVTVTGLIRDDEERVRQLDRLARSSNARAVIVHVDSPGGTTAGSEQLFDALGRVLHFELARPTLHDIFIRIAQPDRERKQGED